MKQLLLKLLKSFIIYSIFCYFSVIVTGQEYDRELAQKYGLTISPPDNKLKPAPLWLLNADMATSSRNVWKGHEFELKDTLMTRIVRVRSGNNLKTITEHYPVETIDSLDGSLVRGVSLISHVPHSKKAFEEAIGKGFKAIPYVHFSCIHTNLDRKSVV